MNKYKHTISGFTLIELMVTLSIAVILLTVAIPSFNSMLRGNRAVTQANELVSGLYLARSEAAKRGIRVSVCPRTNPVSGTESCSGNNDWSGGWLVFTDAAGTAGDFDGADLLLRVKGTLDGNPSFTSTKNNVQYKSTGSVTATLSFTLKPYGCSANQQRNIAVSATGRAAVKSESC